MIIYLLWRDFWFIWPFTSTTSVLIPTILVVSDERILSRSICLVISTTSSTAVIILKIVKWKTVSECAGRTVHLRVRDTVTYRYGERKSVRFIAGNTNTMGIISKNEMRCSMLQHRFTISNPTILFVQGPENFSVSTFYSRLDRVCTKKMV